MAASPKVLAGIAAVLYKNTGTYGTPVWTAHTSVKDAKPQFGWGFADTSSRLYPMKLYTKTLLDLAIQIVMRADPADAFYAAWITNAFKRDNPFDLLILNGPISQEGSAGMRGEFLISMTEEPEEIEGTIFATFDLKPTLTTNGVPTIATIANANTVTLSAMGSLT